MALQECPYPLTQLYQEGSQVKDYPSHHALIYPLSSQGNQQEPQIAKHFGNIVIDFDRKVNEISIGYEMFIAIDCGK